MNYKIFFTFLNFLILITLIFSASASASVVINEVMYNPNQCSDSCCEWIELYNPTGSPINLSDWIISDMNSDLSIEYNHTIVFASQINISAQGYFILARQPENFSQYWDVSCPIARFSTTGLNNNPEIIRLYSSNSSLVDEFYYNTSYGANGNDDSLQKIDSSGINDISNWCASIPTPGALNNCSEDQEKTLDLSYESEVECDENFTISINAENFEDGIYDVKIDIRDVITDDRVGKVWNGSKWISTYSYINSALSVSDGNGTASLLFKIEDFDGEAFILPKLRKSGTSSKEEFSENYINVECTQSSTQEESEITVIDSPTSAVFGETIEVELNVYKGDTAKYAVYVYVEDEDGTKVSDKITLHFKTKFTNQTVEIELQLKCKNEAGSYDIVAEGLDEEDREEIDLDACETEDVDNTLTIGDFSYGLTIPNNIYLNKEFTVKLKITNNADNDQNFLAWSYVYRGSKCYSCLGNETRESNAKELIIEGDSFAEVELKNIVGEAEPGSYKLKIKALQEGLKTPKEFTYDIQIEQSLDSLDEDNDENKNNEDQTSTEISALTITGAVIESSAFSINKALPYILATLCMLLVIYIIIKKI